MNERKGRIKQKGMSNIGNWLKYFRFKNKGLRFCPEKWNKVFADKLRKEIGSE